MPTVHVHILPGSTREQKAQVVREMTETLQCVLGKRPEHTHILILEVAEENWGYAGQLTDDWKRQAGQ